MAAPLSPHLFGERFSRLHRMTVDQALQGYARYNDQVLDPEEYEHTVRRVFLPNKQPWSESVQQITESPAPPEDIIKRWARNHKELLVGHPTRIASDLGVLTREMQGRGRSPEVPIYRGADMPPEAQVDASPDEPLSFTEDRHVATSFARGGGGRGQIYRREPTDIRGLFVPDYVERERTVGQSYRPEREWLVDPSSLRSGTPQ